MDGYQWLWMIINGYRVLWMVINGCGLCYQYVISMVMEELLYTGDVM